MKMYFIAFASIIFFSTNVYAKIWRVNNVAGIVADFTTVQAAHDAAAIGDTIHVEPSVTNYGDLTMTKRLSIISTGQFSSTNPGIQQDIKQGFVGNVYISNPQANGSLLSIRYLFNIVITGGTVGNISLLNCASITPFDDCAGFSSSQGTLYISDADNIIVSGGWFAGIEATGHAQNIIISNNLIGNRIQVKQQSSAVIRNNVIHILSINACTGTNPVMLNSQITNNIFLKGMTAGNIFTGSSLHNNFSADASLPAGNGNVNGVNMSSIFIDNNGGFTDNPYRLKTGSPAIGAGMNGEDLGAFGGSTPYRLAVTPSIPSIYRLSVPSGATGATMNIIFSTRTNN